MIPEADETTLAEMSIKELYALFMLMEEDDLETKQAKEEYKINKFRITNGIKIKTHIEYIINEMYKVWANSKTIVLEYGEAYDLAEFMTEIRTRENLIRKTILENQEEGSTEPR